MSLRELPDHFLNVVETNFGLIDIFLKSKRYGFGQFKDILIS